MSYDIPTTGYNGVMLKDCRYNEFESYKFRGFQRKSFEYSRLPVRVDINNNETLFEKWCFTKYLYCLVKMLKKLFQLTGFSDQQTNQTCSRLD